MVINQNYKLTMSELWDDKFREYEIAPLLYDKVVSKLPKSPWDNKKPDWDLYSEGDKFYNEVNEYMTQQFVRIIGFSLILYAHGYEISEIIREAESYIHDRVHIPYENHGSNDTEPRRISHWVFHEFVGVIDTSRVPF